MAVFVVVINVGCLGASVTSSGLVLGVGMVSLKTRHPRTTWFQPAPRSLCSAEGWAPLVFGATGWPVATFLTSLVRLPCKSRLCLFPIHAAPVVGLVVAPAATALRLSSRSRTYTEEVRSGSDSAAGCVSAVTLRVAKTLRLHYSGSFGATYATTVTRIPHSSVSHHTVGT